MGSRKWLMVAVLVCGLATACQDYNTNLSVQTASSALAFISPSSVLVGSQGFTITANGTGFTSGAEILWNGTALTTTLVSAIQLTAAVPASDLTTSGVVQVSVRIPGSAQSPTQNVNTTTTTEISNVILFTVTATPSAPPSLTSLSASTTSAASTPYCSTQGFTLTVNGANFTSDTKVNWNGVPASATTFVSASQVAAPIATAQVAFPGTAVVTVSNSLGTSNSLPFTLSTPSGGVPEPSGISVSTSSAPAGSPALALAVSGTNILPCTTIQWLNQNSVAANLPTTYVPGSNGNGPQVTATVPSSDFLISGPGNQTACVLVFNITPLSTTLAQCISPPIPPPPAAPFLISAPAIASLSSSANPGATPPSTPSCTAAGITLTVNGSNFVNGSTVVWNYNPPATNGTGRLTTFVSASQLTAVIPFSDIALANPSPGIGIVVMTGQSISNTVDLSIAAPSSLPTPAIGSISPSSATAGSSSATLTLTGTNFFPCSTVQWNGTTTGLQTVYGGPTTLTVTVPAADLASVGTAQITVATPSAVANSPAVSFPIGLATVTSVSASSTNANNAPYCSAVGFTLAVNGTGFAPGLIVNWNGSPRPTTFVSSTQLTATISPADTASLATGAAAVAITVSGSGIGTNSNHMPFSLTQLPSGSPLPLPAISSINPPNSAAGSPAVALTVSGTSISSCSEVELNGSPLPVSIFVGTSGMAAAIPGSDLTTATSPSSPDQVTVFTPALPASECSSACGGGTSNVEPFAVFTPGTPGPVSIPGAALSLPVMSQDLRYSVFVLASSDGSTETPGTVQNVFVNDSCLGASGCTPSTTLVSAGFGGATVTVDSVAPSISGDVSADGRYVVFLSSATNLVNPSLATSVVSAFVRDTCAGASGCTPSTQLVSVLPGGTQQAGGPTTSATISPTGRYVTFVASATPTSSPVLYLRDTCAGASGCTPSTQALQ
jgi:hypothetical protein